MMGSKMNTDSKRAALMTADAAARDAARANPSPETRAAAVAASAELSAYIMATNPPKRGVGSRAGARQAAERRAMYPRRTR